MTDAAGRLYERVLVLRCQTGEPAALSELITLYSPRVRFYLRKMAGDPAADDLLQDVWFDVFRKITRLKDPGALSAWIYRIARNKAYHQLRRRRVAPLPTDHDIAEQPDDHDDQWTPEDVDRVRAALDRLAPEHREVLLLRFVEDMNYDHIAAVIACPVGTVRSRIFYAKRSLRQAIERTSNHERTRTRQSPSHR